MKHQGLVPDCATPKTGRTGSSTNILSIKSGPTLAPPLPLFFSLHLSLLKCSQILFEENNQLLVDRGKTTVEAKKAIKLPEAPNWKVAPEDV